MNGLDTLHDDDLDIPDDTLLELETHAITSTQKDQVSKPQVAAAQPRSSRIHNASSLHRARAGNYNVPWRPPQRHVNSSASRAATLAAQDPPSQPIDDGENVVNLAEETSTALEWSQTPRPVQRVVNSITRPQSREKAPIDEETAAAYAAADAEIGNAFTKPAEPAIANTEQDRLRARISELEAAISRAEQSEAQARSALATKAGEITIVRENADRERKEHNQRIAALTRSHAEEASKQKAQLEAGRKEREKMQTDNRFLQHDLAQEAERVKRLNGPGKTRVVTERDTPRKARRPGFGDGFDDDEVKTYSPSKSKPKDRESATPRLGDKRKRSVQDSPIHSLTFVKSPSIRREESAPDSPFSQGPVPAPIPDNSERERLTFWQDFINYKPLGVSMSALEVLSQQHFPSKPTELLSSVLTRAFNPFNTESMPLQLARALLGIWSTCLKEQYYEPMPIIIDLLNFTIAHERPSQYALLATEAVPLCFSSLETVTMPVVRGHLNANYLQSIDKEYQDSLARQMDGDKISCLLHTICQACSLNREHISCFWRMADFTSSMLLVHKALHMSRAMTGLNMLVTSVLSESFGAINDDPAGQAQWEKDSVYRLTFALVDVPTVPAGQAPYKYYEIIEFRLAVLAVFAQMCEYDYGSKLLAEHPQFIGRLVRFLDEQVTRLYSLPPSSRQFPLDEDEEANEHDLVVETINTSMRILEHLLTTFRDSIDLSARFAVITGGYHKFLISMTRIAFIERSTVYDYGIDEEVVDAAHEILDAFLTPEDGEAVAKALETPVVNRNDTTRPNKTQSFDPDMMEIDHDVSD